MSILLATGGNASSNDTLTRFRKRLAEGRITPEDLEKVELACLETLETLPSTPRIKGVTMRFVQAARIARLEVSA